MDKAIIGGTGVYSISEDVQNIEVQTEYGNVSLNIVKVDGEEIAFLSRHGNGHSVPPHRINYRANMKALEKLGVKYVFATATVGAVKENLEIGDIVVLDDFMDFTKSRTSTFYEGDDGVVHTDMSDPYCMNLRRLFVEKANMRGVNIKNQGIYICTEGPRFETAGEIRFYGTLGGDVVGMTNVPEVVLAKELGMCYAAVGLVSNYCTGVKGHNLAEDDMGTAVAKAKEDTVACFMDVFKEAELQKDNCRCSRATLRL